MVSRLRRWIKRLALGLLFVAALVLSLQLGTVERSPGKATAQAIDGAALVQQGVSHYQAGEFQAAIAQWQRALALYQDENSNANLAIVLENLARGYQQLGQTNQEIQYWQQAVEVYQQLGDRLHWGRMLTEQAQTFSRLGQSRRAIALLCGELDADCVPTSALQLARSMGDRQGEAAALGSLGEAYRARGRYAQAVGLLEQSQAIAAQLDNLGNLAAALNGLGNVQVGLAQESYRRAITADQTGDARSAVELRQAGQAQDASALAYFQQSIELAERQGDRWGQMRSLLNAIPVYYRTGDTATAAVTRQRSLAVLETLPQSQQKVYAALDLAHLLQPVTAGQPLRMQCFETSRDQATALLQQAVSIAQAIGDRRSESFALGELAYVYECQQDYPQAMRLTQQARWAAEQDLRAKDSLYLWEWQTGRLLKAQGQIAEAIAAYEQAVATLETIRNELLTADRDLQFDFRDTVDPVYRELVELRLERAVVSEQSRSTERSSNIDAALRTLDSLRLAELQNYFGDNCVIITDAPAPIDSVQADSATAIFSSVILSDRTAIIVSFPNGQQQIAWIDIDPAALRDEINAYRRSLERFFTPFNPQQAAKLYDWIIAPFADALTQAQIKTLVFVQDGILRSVPMASLYDGDRYLIQTYAIATTPSLALTDTTALNRQNLRALALGLTQEAQIDGQIFPALSNVDREIQAIASELPGSKPLLNQEFTRDRLQQELTQTSYPILHIATHGQFGTDPENTFLVTGDRQKLTLTDLDAILRRTRASNTIDLLFLTACQTATGDDRAALGLAGVAVQAGARSALASLWFIDDAATAQIATQFYANLQNPDLSKAQSLQAAQLSILATGGQTAHPAFWAPFILIGNWL